MSSTSTALSQVSVWLISVTINAILVGMVVVMVGVVVVVVITEGIFGPPPITPQMSASTIKVVSSNGCLRMRAAGCECGSVNRLWGKTLLLQPRH